MKTTLRMAAAFLRGNDQSDGIGIMLRPERNIDLQATLQDLVTKQEALHDKYVARGENRYVL